MADGRRSSTARDAVGGDEGGGAESGDGGAVVELSLRLPAGGSSGSGTGTGSGSSAAAEAMAMEVAARRRSMTIFYGGRVCAVDVTELQAMAIITMANQQILTEQQKGRDHRDGHQDDSSSSTAAAQQPSSPPVSSSPRRQGLEEAAAVPTTISHAAAAGLSMKRSLQLFLQKRKTRAAAVGSPYAGGLPAAQPTRHHPERVRVHDDAY